MDLFSVLWATVFVAGVGVVVFAEYAFHRDTTEYMAVTVCGLILVVLGVRELLTNALYSDLPLGVGVLSSLLIQFGVGFAVYVGVRSIMRRAGVGTRERAVQ